LFSGLAIFIDESIPALQKFCPGKTYQLLDKLSTFRKLKKLFCEFLQWNLSGLRGE